jgi:hypothetical protein
MKDKGKTAARVNAGPSHDHRNARKGKRKDVDAPVQRVTDGVVVEDADGRWVLATRVVDTVDLLHRRGMIDDRQRMAGSTYRDAVDAVQGGMASALDMSRVRRSGGAGGPVPTALWGADMLAEARKVLGVSQGLVVASVLAEGRTVEETARRRMGAKASRRDIEFIGRMFRDALTALADAWHPVVRARMTAVLADDARPSGTQGGAIEPGTVVHATLTRIFEHKP